MSPFRFIPVLAVCLLLQGCVGVLVGSRDTTTIPNPSISKAAYLGAVARGGGSAEYTAEWLRSNWGAPASIKAASEGTGELWTYDFKRQCWCGVMPMVIIPIPLMVPTGTEKVVFLLRDDRVVNAKRVEWRTSGVGGGLGPDGWHWSH